MIVLVQPMYSKQELNADSNYVVYSQLLRAMARVRPNYHFYVIFPDDKSGYKYEPDGLFKLPTITRIPQRISPRKLANAISYDASWYDELFRRIGFDVIWCNLVEIAGHLKHAGTSTYENVARPLLVAAHNYVIHESLPYPIESMEHVVWAQLSGGMQSDFNVFNSEHCEWMFFDNAARYLSEQSIKRLRKTAKRINYGTLEESLRPVQTGNEVPVIAYNHRLQGYKNYMVTFKLLDELHREGLKFKVRYMNNAAEHISAITKYPFVEIRLCATRKEYLAALRGCDLNVTNSQHETFCIAAIESMALGQPLIAPLGITFPEITGRKELDYPYLFTNQVEQKEMLRRMLTDASERKKWGTKLSAFVVRSFNSTLWAQNYAELFESHKIRIGSPDDAKEFVRSKISENNGCTLEAFWKDILHIEVNGRVPFSSQSMTPTKALRMARELGAKITVEAGQPRVRI